MTQSLKEAEEARQKQKQIDDWLPVTSARNAKWWYSAFHNVTAMVGAGVLSLPYAMAELGCYSTIAWGAAIHKGKVPNVDYSYKAKSNVGAVFNFFSGLGDIAFAYAGHNVVLEIQATIPSTPEKPSKGPMWKGVIVAYIVVALCYFPVCFVGYYMYGNSVEDNILISLEKPVWLIAAANMFVVIHVIGSYQVFAMGVFDMVETFLVKKMNFPPSFTLRFITRTVYVAITMVIGMAIPFFGGLLGFFGGFAFAPTTYFVRKLKDSLLPFAFCDAVLNLKLPCIMWLAIYKPRRFSLSWCINWTCIILGVTLMLLAPIGALRSIILQSKTYTFFS